MYKSILKQFHCFCIAAYFTFFGIANSENAAPAYLSSTEQNALGFAGWDGELNAWWDLGILEFSPTMKLPLRFNFNSAQDEIGNSVIGWNWWFPLVESTAMKVDEINIKIRMPGGLILKLRESNRVKGRFADSNGDWSGQISEKGVFNLVNTNDNTEFEFKNGHLKYIRFADGNELIWNYSKLNHPLSIGDHYGRVLLEISYNAQGQINKIEFRGKNGEQKLVNLKIGLVSNSSGTVIPLLSSINRVDGSKINFDYSLSEDFATMKIGDETLREKDVFRWDSRDGTLISSGGLDYKSNIYGNGKYLFIRSLEDKFFDSYSFNSATGEGILKNRDTIIVTRYVLSAGKSFNKISYYFEKSSEGESSTNNYYDSDGNLTREVINGTSIYYVRSIPDFEKTKLKGSDVVTLWPTEKIMMSAFSSKGSIKRSDGTSLYEFDFLYVDGVMRIEKIFSFEILDYLDENLTLHELINVAIRNQ